MRAEYQVKMCGITGGIKNLIPILTIGNEGAGRKNTRCGPLRPKMGDEK